MRLPSTGNRKRSIILFKVDAQEDRQGKIEAEGKAQPHEYYFFLQLYFS